MATTPETSTQTESAGTLFQALRNAGVESDLAYRADDEVRNRAGQNVISVIGAKMDAKTKELATRMDAQATALETRIDKQGAELHSKIDTRTEELGARMDAQATALETRIDKQGAELHWRRRSTPGRRSLRRTGPEWMLRPRPLDLTRIDKQGMELNADGQGAWRRSAAFLDAQTCRNRGQD